VSAACAALSVAALLSPARARAFPWPVKPFHRQHPIRANFGDPRMVFDNGLYDDGIDGPVRFRFHNGVDIAAPDGTPVYAVISGIVKKIDDQALAIVGVGRSIDYFHIDPLVVDGQHVKALRTVLGFIAKGFGHVHLGELRGGRIWNPLAKGGLAPYHDVTTPTVRAIYIRRWNTLGLLSPNDVCGRVSIVADAFDSQPVPVPGKWHGFPLAPALLTWSVHRVGTTRRLAAASGKVDFRTTLPPARDFWKVYARGTYQNGPRFGRQQYIMPGLFLYQLTPRSLDTEKLRNGRYRVVVRAEDLSGNTGVLIERFRVDNDPMRPSGCSVTTPPTSYKP